MHIVLYILTTIPLLGAAFCFYIFAAVSDDLNWLLASVGCFIAASVLYAGGAIVEAIVKKAN